MKTLLKHAMIVTMDDEGRVYKEGNLLFEDDRILQVGNEPVDERDCDEVLDLKGKLVLPGFVNTHVHTSLPGVWRTTWICSPGCMIASGLMRAI